MELSAQQRPKDGIARKATEADIEVIVELAREARQEMLQYRGGQRWLNTEAQQEPLKAFFINALAESTTTQVLAGIWTNAIVGYAWARSEQRQDNKLLVRIGELYVMPDARSVGVGESLFNALRNWAYQQNAHAIEAFVLPGHRSAKNFFETFKLTAHALTVYTELR